MSRAKILPKWIYAAVLTVLCVGCTGIFEPSDAPVYEFTASFADIPGSKTLMAQKDTEGKRSVIWSLSDAVMIGDSVYTVNRISIDGRTAYLSGAGARKSDTVGKYESFYPVSLRGSDNIFRLPSEQTYSASEGNHSAAFFPMYALSTSTHLEYHNLCSVLSLSLTGDYKVGRIEMTATGGVLSGAFTVNKSGEVPVLTMQASGSPTVTLRCPDGGKQLDSTTPTEFCIAIPAGSYASGTFSIKVYNSSGSAVVELTNSRANATTGSVFARNMVYEIVLTPAVSGTIASGGQQSADFDVSGSDYNSNWTITD